MGFLITWSNRLTSLTLKKPSIRARKSIDIFIRVKYVVMQTVFRADGQTHCFYWVCGRYFYKNRGRHFWKKVRPEEK